MSNTSAITPAVAPIRDANKRGELLIFVSVGKVAVRQGLDPLPITVWQVQGTAFARMFFKITMDNLFKWDQRSARGHLRVPFTRLPLLE